MRAPFSAVLLIAFLSAGTISAQTPAPIILQAATPATALAKPAVPTSPAATDETKNLMQLLQEMQATNATTIQKQEAALQTLDALQKAAEDIKIFSKRG
jgi:hypothetical protein